MKLNLTTEQVNQILNALAQQPYIQVHELINTIQQQGQAQMQLVDANAQQAQPKQAATKALTKEVLETASNGKG